MNKKVYFLISKLSITLLSVLTILKKRWYWSLSLEQAGVHSRLMLMTELLIKGCCRSVNESAWIDPWPAHAW